MSTRTSSTTGADADDDLSPFGSPLADATVPATDVSDMLEAPAPGVSVLRLTGVAENERKKKQKPEAFKTVETKKQRQRRIKNENKKLMVEDAEKQRRVLLEKQLHTARENERQEIARAKPVTSNAWKNNPGHASNGAQSVRENHSTPLLDTFDLGFQPLPATLRGASPSTPASADDTRPLGSSTQESWAEHLPSEEEQMRLLGAMSSENEWRTVSNKKKEKRKVTRLEGSVSDASNSDSHIIKDTTDQTLPSINVPETVHFSGEMGQSVDTLWAP
jgi:hypothetical protein